MRRVSRLGAVAVLLALTLGLYASEDRRVVVVAVVVAGAVWLADRSLVPARRNGSLEIAISPGSWYRPLAIPPER